MRAHSLVLRPVKPDRWEFALADYHAIVRPEVAHEKLEAFIRMRSSSSSPTKRQGTANRRKVLEYVMRNQEKRGVKLKDMAEGLDLPYYWVHRWAQALLRDGVLYSEGLRPLRLFGPKEIQVLTLYQKDHASCM